MNEKRAAKFKAAIDRELYSENILTGDHSMAHKILSRCVMGSILIKAYKILYENDAGTAS